MATVVPDIGPLVSIVGGVGFSTLGLIVPVTMEIVWYWYPKDDGGDDDGDDDDGDDGDDNHPPGRRDGGAVAVAWKNGDATAAVAAVTVFAGENNGEKPVDRRRVAYRIARYVKSAAILLIAGLALIGGGYYNICEILNLSNDTSSAAEQ